MSDAASTTTQTFKELFAGSIGGIVQVIVINNVTLSKQTTNNPHQFI